jgi:hypothetical protein
MAFYIIVFVAIGFVIGIITPKDKQDDAYVWYVLISIGWFFISGPFAILAFVELGVGDMLARKIKGQESTVDKKNIDSGNIIDADFNEVKISELNFNDVPKNIENKTWVPTRKHQAKLVNPSRYNSKTEVIDSGQYCSYGEWLRLGYQVKKGEKGCRRDGFTVLFDRSQVIRKHFH